MATTREVSEEFIKNMRRYLRSRPKKFIVIDEDTIDRVFAELRDGLKEFEKRIKESN